MAARLPDSSAIEIDVQDAPLVAVHGDFFANQRVILDGKSHTNCTFEACTLVYNGSKAFRFSGNTLRMPIAIMSDNPEIERMMYLLHQLDLMKIPFRNEKGEYVEVEGVSTVKAGGQTPQSPLNSG